MAGGKTEMKELAKYEAAKHALAEAVRVDEVMDIRDKAAAISAAARVAKDRQLEIDASEIRIRAERRLGEMIREQKQGEGLNKGAAAGGVKESPRGNYTEPRDTTPTLADIGISKKLSSRAQAIAAIPKDDFEITLDEHRAQQQAVTATTMHKLAEKAKGHEHKEAIEVTAQIIADKAIFFLTQIKARNEVSKKAFESVVIWCKKQIKECK